MLILNKNRNKRCKGEEGTGNRHFEAKIGELKQLPEPTTGKLLLHIKEFKMRCFKRPFSAYLKSYEEHLTFQEDW